MVAQAVIRNTTSTGRDVDFGKSLDCDPGASISIKTSPSRYN